MATWNPFPGMDVAPKPAAPKISLPSTVSGSGPAPAWTQAYTQAQQPAAPADTGGGGGGGSSITQALASNPFETDPGYLAALAAEQAGSQQADAALQAAREAAIVQFGDPGLAASISGFSLNPDTAAAAQANTQAGNSQLAQLNRQRDLNQQTIQNNLAAHGIIRSGDLGYKTGQNQQTYGTELYNTQQGVLSGLSQALQNNLATKAGLRSGSISALTSAYNTYVQNPAFWGAAGDGGSTAAADANAVQASPTLGAGVPSAPAPYGTRPVTATPVSRLAASVNPRAYQTARNAI